MAVTVDLIMAIKVAVTLDKKSIAILILSCGWILFLIVFSTLWIQSGKSIFEIGG